MNTGDTSFLSKQELHNLGLKNFGNNVFISRKASFYNKDKISLGDNVRIDDFCILSDDITIGSYVHIAAYSALYGKNGILIGNFCGLSPRVTIFSAIDDFSGEFMISPMVPIEFTNVNGGLVVFKNFVQIGVNSIVFPGVTLEEGVVVGAMSLVKTNLKEWTINAGIPAKYLKDRKKTLLNFKNQMITNIEGK